MELVFVSDFSADPVKAQLIINSLREKIAPFKEFLLMIVESPVRMEGDQDSLRLVLHFIFFSFNSGLFFSPGHDTVPVGTQLGG